MTKIQTNHTVEQQWDKLDEAVLKGDKWRKNDPVVVGKYFDFSWHLKTVHVKNSPEVEIDYDGKISEDWRKVTVSLGGKEKACKLEYQKKRLFLRSKNIVIGQQYTNKIKKKSNCKDKTRWKLPKSITTQNQRIRATSNKIFDKNCSIQQEKSIQKTCEKKLFVCLQTLYVKHWGGMAYPSIKLLNKFQEVSEYNGRNLIPQPLYSLMQMNVNTETNSRSTQQKLKFGFKHI